MNNNTNVIIHPRCLDRRIDMKAVPKNKNSKHANKVILALVTLILVFVLLAFVRFAWEGYKLDKEIHAYLIQLEEAKIINAQLLAEVELAQDPIYIEKLARERLGLVKTGEKVVMPAKPGYVMPLKEPTDGEIQH